MSVRLVWSVAFSRKKSTIIFLLKKYRGAWHSGCICTVIPHLRYIHCYLKTFFLISLYSNGTSFQILHPETDATQHWHALPVGLYLSLPRKLNPNEYITRSTHYISLSLFCPSALVGMQGPLPVSSPEQWARFKCRAPSRKRGRWAFFLLSWEIQERSPPIFVTGA